VVADPPPLRRRVLRRTFRLWVSWWGSRDPAIGYGVNHRPSRGLPKSFPSATPRICRHTRHMRNIVESTRVFGHHLPQHYRHIRHKKNLLPPHRWHLVRKADGRNQKEKHLSP
jgi:hypothetical protein